MVPFHPGSDQNIVHVYLSIPANLVREGSIHEPLEYRLGVSEHEWHYPEAECALFVDEVFFSFSFSMGIWLYPECTSIELSKVEPELLSTDGRG